MSQLSQLARQAPLNTERPVSVSAQIRQIADSMKRFGLTNPIIADDTGEIVVGQRSDGSCQITATETLPGHPVNASHRTRTAGLQTFRQQTGPECGLDREILSLEVKELLIALPEINLDPGITPDETYVERVTVAKSAITIVFPPQIGFDNLAVPWIHAASGTSSAKYRAEDCSEAAPC